MLSYSIMKTGRRRTIVGAMVAVAFEFILRGRATKGGAEAAQGILDESATGI
jgi:hypothetical protein